MGMTRNQLNSERDDYEAAHREMDAKEVKTAGLSDMVKRGAAAVGKAILGDRTKNDATGDGQAYRLHLNESQASGDAPMSREDFQKSLATKA